MPHELALTGATPSRSKDFPAWPRPSAAVEAELAAVLASGHWWQSSSGAAERLEGRLSDWFGTRAAICVMNGTVALEIALRAFGIGAGDEVLVPATTFVSTASAVAVVGATPVPVDIRADTCNVDLDAAADSVTSRTRAFILVHLAGQTVDLIAARRFADRTGIMLIEDSAQAFGAEWEGRRVGTAGDVTTLSFQAAKLVPAGEGGAVLVRSDAALARKVELIANCGRPRGSGGYEHTVLGTNARISEFNAAVALAHLPGYDELWRQRDAVMRRVRGLAVGADLVATDPRVTRHDWYMAMLRVPAGHHARGLANHHVVTALRAEGFPCQVLYPSWHRLPAFTGLVEQRAGQCPTSVDATGRVIWLHHRLLLDEEFPEQLDQAWRRILDAGDELLAMA